MSDTDKDQRREISSLLSQASSQIDLWGRPPKWPGLCGECKYFSLIRTSTGEEVPACPQKDHAFDRRYLRRDDPIVDCSLYWPRWAKEAHDLAREARLITTLERVGQYL